MDEYRQAVGALPASLAGPLAQLAAEAEGDDDEYLRAAPPHAPRGDEGEAVPGFERELRLRRAQLGIRPAGEDFLPQRRVYGQGRLMAHEKLQFRVRHALTAFT